MPEAALVGSVPQEWAAGVAPRAAGAPLQAAEQWEAGCEPLAPPREDGSLPQDFCAETRHQEDELLAPEGALCDKEPPPPEQQLFMAEEVTGLAEEAQADYPPPPRGYQRGGASEAEQLQAELEDCMDTVQWTSQTITK